MATRRFYKVAERIDAMLWDGTNSEELANHCSVFDHNVFMRVHTSSSRTMKVPDSLIILHRQYGNRFVQLNIGSYLHFVRQSDGSYCPDILDKADLIPEEAIKKRRNEQ